MYEIISVDTIAQLLTITIKGSGAGLQNGLKVTDNNGNVFCVDSVAMATPHTRNLTILVVGVVRREREFGDRLWVAGDEV